MNHLKKKLFLLNDLNSVEFTNHVDPRIKVKPMYYCMGFSPSPQIFGRQIVLDRLCEALQFLPNEIGFLVWDVYRPRAVQKKLFEWMRIEVRKKNPWLSDEENYVETKKYMSPPSVSGEAYCPPHLSGGAIDLTLFDLLTGEPFKMGTGFDDCTELAHSDFFEINPPIAEQDKEIYRNRSMLTHAMESVGFVRYQYEWWHFDIGDIFWSRVTGKKVLFGPLYGDSEWGVGF